MNRVFIAGYIRSPFGKFGGTLKNVDIYDLGATLVNGLLEKYNVEKHQIEEFYLGNCAQIEGKDYVGGIPARQILLKAGLSPHVTSYTIDRACTSATGSIKLAYNSIKLGDADVVIAGGVEIMSAIPRVEKGSRWGKKMGDMKLEDPLFKLGYKDYNPVAVDTGEVALEYGVSREDQDIWSFKSHQKYEEARKAGKYKDEILPIEIKNRKSAITIFDEDESPRPKTTLEALEKLSTIYGSPTITAGNAPGLNDGGAMMLLVSEKKMNELKLTPLAEVVSVGSFSDEARYIGSVPGDSINLLLDSEDMTINDIDLIEINEAFAAQPLISSKIIANRFNSDLEEVREKINVNGGAVAMGHPIGATGIRLVGTLALELKRRRGGYGIASICGGLAQGDSVLIKV